MQYDDALSLNVSIVADILCWREDASERSNELLVKIFDKLADITNQEVRRVLQKLGLSVSTVDDMKQDAFLKLRDLLPYYDIHRCPVFITFWRRCLGNHLLTLYYEQNREWELTADTQVEAVPDSTAEKFFVEELTAKYDREFADLPIFLVILQERVLATEDVKTTQASIAIRFNKTQGYISRLEKWLRETIKKDFRFSC